MAFKRLLESKFLKLNFVKEFLTENTIAEITKKTTNHKPTYLAVIDGTEIRKPCSKKLENLQGVRSLKGEIINGFRSVASVLISEDNRDCYLLEHTTFSCKESSYKSDTDYDLKAIKQVHKLAKHVNLIYVCDRGYDNYFLLNQIDKQGDTFIVRAKYITRSVYETTKPIHTNLPLKPEIKQRLATPEVLSVKLGDFTIHNSFKRKVAFLKLKRGDFTNVKVYYRYSEILIPDTKKEDGLLKVTVIEVTLYDCKNKEIFKTPMRLLTNKLNLTPNEVQDIYFKYLQRHGIEQVFKFLKSTLNLEKFQIKSLNSIKKLVALTFLTAAYFYFNNRAMLDNPVVLNQVKMVCKLGNGKDKIGLKYLRKGLESLHSHILVSNWQKENGLSDEQVLEIANSFGLGVLSG
jgi:hypothetical protein